MRFYPLFSLVSCAATVSAAISSPEDRVALLECKMEKVHGGSVDSCHAGARFASGRPVTLGYNLSAFVDVLYWKFYQGGNEYTVENTTDLPNMFGTMKKFDYEWEPGYRLGASYAFPDQWDMTVSFTRILPDKDIKKHAPAGGELDPVFPYSVSGSYGDVYEKLKYSVLNFELGSSYFVSRFLYLRPHFGAQGAWIHQKIRTSSTYLSTYNRFQNEFNGGGLRVGLDTKWFLSNQWNIVLNAAASALYGRFDVLMGTQSTSSSYHMDTSISRPVPALQSLIGLCWETNFSEDANHVSLLLAYENNYWWRQNQLIRSENTLGEAPYGTRLSEDLGSQGLTFDFTLFF